jgi:ribosome-associated heat shock protein Hsp15
MSAEESPEPVRLDVWLDVSCVFKTRSQAKEACEGGKIDVNGARAKPHRELRVGDRVSVTAKAGQRREIVVRGLASRSVPRAQARTLYEDVTPPVAAEVREARRLDRMLAPKLSEGRPDKRDRREIIRRKGR